MNKKRLLEKVREISIRYEKIQRDETQTVVLAKEVTDRLEEFRDLSGIEYPMWALISGIVETFLEESSKMKSNE